MLLAIVRNSESQFQQTVKKPTALAGYFNRSSGCRHICRLSKTKALLFPGKTRTLVNPAPTDGRGVFKVCATSSPGGPHDHTAFFGCLCALRPRPGSLRPALCSARAGARWRLSRQAGPLSSCPARRVVAPRDRSLRAGAAPGRSVTVAGRGGTTSRALAGTGGDTPDFRAAARPVANHRHHATAAPGQACDHDRVAGASAQPAAPGPHHQPRHHRAIESERPHGGPALEPGRARRARTPA